MKVPTDFPSCLGIPEWCHKPLNSKYMCSGRNALCVSLYNKRARSYFPVFIFLHTRIHNYHHHYYCWQQKQQQLTHPLCLLFCSRVFSFACLADAVENMLILHSFYSTRISTSTKTTHSNAIYHHYHLHTTITIPLLLPPGFTGCLALLP